MTASLLDPDAIREARSRIRPYLSPSPLRRSFALAHRGLNLLKLECWQPTGSFKVRGALSNLAALSPEERAKGVVAASAGNHALGIAFAASVLQEPVAATLFVPRDAPRSKLEKLRAFPVGVVEVEGTYDDAHEAAMAHGERTGARYVHAFDDPLTAAGQGTLALELLEECPDVGTVVIPVGGGGLIAAVAAVLKSALRDVRIVAVQPDASPALRDSLRAGQPLLTYHARPTLADGLAGGIGEIVFAHRHLIDEVAQVSEDEIEDAIVALLAKDQVVVEGSGAVAAAAILTGRVAAHATRPTVAVLTGGNIDVSVLARLLQRRA
jgi:threonine dehydratase